ncbi:MAG: septum formation initiator family protein [Bifidobacteriaceae bacterium]|jgi:cell division protein FtsL|nr:septum formation initiator family protein [Bifidobacteriaceae bacterium]
MSKNSGPKARRPAAAGRLRAKAQDIEATRREEAIRAGRKLRIGFQVVLLALIGLLAFSLVFPTLRLYMAQQVEKEQLRAEVEAASKANEDLEAQLKRWDDPAYVEAQARQRLGFAMPGDKTFRVSDPENAPSPDVSQAPAPVEPTHLAEDDSFEEEDPWYADLWLSAVVAGNVGE